jgi:hypothetical protein
MFLDLHVLNLLIVTVLSTSFRFARCFAFAPLPRFQESFQIIEARCPEHPVLLDPGVDRAQRLRIELVYAMSPFPMFANQVGTSQQPQVLGNCRPRDGKSTGDLSRWLAALAKQV